MIPTIIELLKQAWRYLLDNKTSTQIQHHMDKRITQPFKIQISYCIIEIFNQIMMLKSETNGA